MTTERADKAQRTPFARSWGGKITAIEYEGRPVVVARELGGLLDYAEEGRKLVDLIGGAWSDEFIPDVDLIVLRNGRLAEFKRICAELGVDLVDKRAPSLLLLTESGIQLVLARTEKPEGKAFRRWLVTEVIPAYQASRALPGPEAPAAALPGATPPTHRGGRSVGPSRADAATLAADVRLLRQMVAKLAARGEMSTGARVALEVLLDELPTHALQALPSPPTPKVLPFRLGAPTPDPFPDLPKPGKSPWTLTTLKRALAAGEIDEETGTRHLVTLCGASVIQASATIPPEVRRECVRRIGELLEELGVREAAS